MTTQELNALADRVDNENYDIAQVGDRDEQWLFTDAERDAIVSALRTAATSQASVKAMREETGWLIEMGDPPVYCVIDPKDYDEHVTSDACKALRFARREDAQAFSDYLGWTSPPVRIVEHMWADGKERAAIAECAREG